MQNKIKEFFLKQQWKLIETHISYVFLKDQIVFKIKKSILLPFVDFTDLNIRKENCLKEIALNKSFSPNLCQGLYALVQEKNQWMYIDQDQLTEDHTPLEWAIKLNRFQENDLLSNLAQHNQLEYSVHILPFILELTTFYDQLQPVHIDWVTAIKQTIHTNKQVFMQSCPHVFSHPQIENIISKQLDILKHLTPLLHKRVDDKMIRNCHGDLHLGNICLFQGKPIAFDFIEFNKNFSEIDILYDFSFLIMDLFMRVSSKSANLALSHYLLKTKTCEGLELMPIFMSIRGSIRSMLSAIQMEHNPHLKEDVFRYLDFSHQILEKPSPRCVFIGGLPGSGKTAVGNALLEQSSLGLTTLFFSSDDIRKLYDYQNLSKSPQDANHYTLENRLKVVEILFQYAQNTLDAGYNVIIETTFTMEKTQQLLTEFKATNPTTQIYSFWLEASQEILQQRLAQRKKDIFSEATSAVLQTLTIPPLEKYWTILQGNETVEELTNTIHRLLN